MGIDVAMITGDARQVAEAVGRELGIDEVFAEVLPEDKDKAVIVAAGARAACCHGRRRRERRARRWPAPTSGWRSAPAPTSPSSRPGSCSPPAIRAAWPA